MDGEILLYCKKVCVVICLMSGVFYLLFNQCVGSLSGSGFGKLEVRSDVDVWFGIDTQGTLCWWTIQET